MKGIAGVRSRLLMALLLQGGVVRTPCKEVAKGSIQMAESLLEKNRRNVIQPGGLFLLFELHQALCSVLIGQTLPTLIVRIGSLLPCPVRDKTTAAEGMGKELFL